MLKIIACGDPHFKVDNIPEVNLFLDRLEKLAIEEKPDLILILGDLLHTHERLHTIALNKAYEFVERMRKIALTYVLVGNHDYIQNQQFLTENHWMNGMKEWNNVVVVDKIEHLELKGVKLVFSPYVPPGRFQEALNTDEREWKDANCIFAHQEFFGCKMGAIVSVEGDKWPLEYPDVVSGHIHSKQKIQKNVYYTGSAMQHAFGESEKNIIAILTWDDTDEYSLKEVDLELPRKRIVYKDINDMEEYDDEETEDKVKISLSGNYDEFKAFKKSKKYKELIKKGKKVVFKPKKIARKEKEEQIVSVDETDFNKILQSLILSEKNPYLFQVHQLVVENRKVSKEDILFL